MKFNDTTTKLGICQEVDDICGSNLISYPIESKTRRANMALSDFVGVALGSDTRWQFDDTNMTDLPIGLTNIVSGQNDYSLSTSMLKILKVEFLNSELEWEQLIPIDINDTPIPLDELMADGIPKYYDKFANSAVLYPKPNFDRDASLRVWFQRDASYFTSTDTTKQPGIPSIFHKYIALKVAEPYARDKRLENYVSIRNEITKIETEDIPEFYAKRNKDDRPILSGKVVDYK
jgi:hypothetical protein